MALSGGGRLSTVCAYICLGSVVIMVKVKECVIGLQYMQIHVQTPRQQMIFANSTVVPSTEYIMYVQRTVCTYIRVCQEPSTVVYHT